VRAPVAPHFVFVVASSAAFSLTSSGVGCCPALKRWVDSQTDLILLAATSCTFAQTLRTGAVFWKIDRVRASVILCQQ